ncbi:MAG: hypothetical protein V4472_01615 [Pseudomonadota bacterium]
MTYSSAYLSVATTGVALRSIVASAHGASRTAAPDGPMPGCAYSPAMKGSDIIGYLETLT